MKRLIGQAVRVKASGNGRLTDEGREHRSDLRGGLGSWLLVLGSGGHLLRD